MLKISMDSRRVSASQNEYVGKGLGTAERTAYRIRVLRLALVNKIDSYESAQRADRDAGNYVLADGRRQTLQQKVLDPYGSRQVPTANEATAAVLRGIRDFRPLHADRACPSAADIDLPCSEDYLVTLYDGPRREFKDLVVLGVYVALRNELRFIWIGREVDLTAAVDALSAETDEWTDLQPLGAGIHSTLSSKCLFYRENMA